MSMIVTFVIPVLSKFLVQLNVPDEIVIFTKVTLNVSVIRPGLVVNTLSFTSPVPVIVCVESPSNKISVQSLPLVPVTSYVKSTVVVADAQYLMLAGKSHSAKGLFVNTVIVTAEENA